MEALIDQITAETSFQYPKTGFSSHYYQPDRVLISSDQSIDALESQSSQEEEFFYSFTVRLPRPALDVKTIQLVRANIPNPVVNIPDSETTFWYYRIPASVIAAGGNVLQDQYLRFVRLLPSWYKPELNINSSSYGFNRTFQSYEDLASELAKSCSADPWYDSDPNRCPFIPNDISLSYNSTQNKFVMTGNNAFLNGNRQFYYISAGYTDSNIWGQSASYLLTGSTVEDSFGFVPGQPFHIYKTLNLRLGFTWNGVNSTLTTSDSGVNAVFAFRFRPVPPLIMFDGSPSSLQFNTNAISYIAESYANLVNTNCVNIYLDLITGSTLDSERNTNLLAAVPMNATNLGIGFYNPVISNPLTKIMNQIYEISITLRSDTGEPFWLPNSAILSLEFAFSY